MAWRTSKYGHRYFYRNRRCGDRVITQYIGTGPVAELAARTEALDRAKRQAEMIAWREKQQRCDELDALVGGLCTTIDQLLMATLLVAGCHRHDWAWRRRRAKRYAPKAA